MALLLLQLQFSLELAAECSRLVARRPPVTSPVISLCLDHLSHAMALAAVIAEGDTSWTAGAGAPVTAGAMPSLDRLVSLLGEARETAVQACLDASGGREVALLGMIAAALASHEVAVGHLDTSAGE